ncbi:MAG: hypothetical protein DRI99_06535 [Candidatus Aminicenantes bacterium]|nr:MAG: hypothetical protein DRI99_06535 [Candidatus Aminicenantes bacterium]HDK26560.1 hypothetical protein [Candidatus Atribacteria bacterium]
MIRKTITLDEDLMKNLSLFARKEQRDISNAIRYTLRIGLLAIENPDLTFEEIKDILEAKLDYEMEHLSEVKLEDF